MSTLAPSQVNADLQQTPEKRDDRGRLRGIDSIRAISALIVVFGHLSLFSDTAVHSSNHILRSAARLSAATWNGPGAVIVFFIISGFCIHLPFRGERPLQPASFLSRRLLRVGLPAIAAYLFARYAVHGLNGFFAVVWSVLCEGVYYLLYPILRPLAGRVGWRNFFLGSYAISLGLAVTHLHRLAAAQNGYDALGISLTWLIGLPCWLLGCWLAEVERSFTLLPTVRIWLLRGGVFLASVLLRIVKFHVHSALASNVFTLNAFALIACVWLGYEIAFYKRNEPSRTLEWMGTWSYSLYLMHPLVIAVLITLNIQWLLVFSSRTHFIVLLLALCLAYVFHWIVEFPSHRLAISVSRKL